MAKQGTRTSPAGAAGVLGMPRKRDSEAKQVVPPASYAGIGGKVEPDAWVENHGGRVIGAVQVTPIFWGPEWAEAGNAELISQMEGFFDTVLASSLIDMLREYSTAAIQIGHGVRKRTVRIPTPPGTDQGKSRTVTDPEVQTALSEWIAAGGVPLPNPNSLYVIYLAPGVVSTLGAARSCSKHCGYHGHLGGTVAYAVVPFGRCKACGFGENALDALTVASSHLLCEAITDPTLETWWDAASGGDEIGDICSGQTTRIGPYLVQRAWSNSQAVCTVRPPGSPTDGYRPVYREGPPGKGIGGYDLQSSSDQALAFDYNSSGKLDHLVLYRPAAGTIWILRNERGVFTPVYRQGDPGTGIGGYDLKSSADRVFAFDYDGSGKLDHLVLYRAGTGMLSIVKNEAGVFVPVHTTEAGMGGFDLRSTADRAFAFDYGGSGSLDHIVFLRPGAGAVAIVRNEGGVFRAVYRSETGIGGYDLLSTADQGFAFDYDGSGKLDHLVLYRPGSGTISILKQSGGVFEPVYESADGIGGYSLKAAADQGFAFDYSGGGKADHLAFFRPGTGTLWILKHGSGVFEAVYRQGDPGFGVGGFELKSSADRMFGFDFRGSGARDHLAVYRPGTGTMWILEKSAESLK